ncbi:armadillo-type protein [Mucor mucedo]|uniref:armadillo-type protein n=1 Tax=Mucor mucedo TaxID=29922 RepID=UPI002220B463|nr:armadillo-type protein [Mucor mucedo]KAI7896233.1 armadillo-type protein [Mucor mucedo]
MQHNTTKDRHSSSAFPSSSRDLDVVLEETDSNEGYSYLDSILDNNYLPQKSSSYLSGNQQVRRSRAGTMPSLAYMEQPTIIPQTAFLNNRHRSGSLTLPAPANLQMSTMYNTWGQEPISPSTEQLLQGDDDFSIARTLRSIGLDEENDDKPRINARSRSYSVNNTVMYQQQPPDSRSRINNSFHTPPPSLDNQPSVGNRPRASSMGRMDYTRLTPPGLSSLWKMQLGTLHDEEYDTSLSLGDSELLANMISIDNISLTENNNNRNSFVPPVINNSNNQQQQQNSVTSRSLWIGNIDASITVDGLTRLFSTYGPIESVRLLMEKECAFINFYHLEDAVHAKDDVLSNHGGRIGTCIVRIGYGRAETLTVTTPIEIPVVSQPTRALWLGNMPANTTQATLERVFSLFGAIESIRVLSHKNCAFINYDTVESASDARDALLQNDTRVQDLWGVRIGFAKVPLLNKATSKQALNDETHINMELWTIMKQLGAPENTIELVKSLQSSSYFESIPPVPEYGVHRRHDAANLRDIRKRLDATTDIAESDSIALDCMDELAEICSDYIGNTVVQRLFEKCSEDMKTMMLKSVAPHLAAMGVHKNGTWAAQKIIDSLKLPHQIQIVCTHIQPFIPPLLLDQFGNYVVQCCLRMHGDTQFIMNAIVEKFVHIAQGRFGARAMRGILEGTLITSAQQLFIAAALLQNSVSLSIHANGALLISWFIESSQIENRYSLLAARLAPHLTQIATHKLGTQILLKLINQDLDLKARACLLEALENGDTMREILSDQARGLAFAIKVISSESLGSDEKSKLREIAHPILTQLQGTGFKKALVEFVAVEEQVAITAVINDYF